MSDTQVVDSIIEVMQEYGESRDIYMQGSRSFTENIAAYKDIFWNRLMVANDSNTLIDLETGIYIDTDAELCAWLETYLPLPYPYGFGAFKDYSSHAPYRSWSCKRGQIIWVQGNRESSRKINFIFVLDAANNSTHSFRTFTDPRDARIYFARLQVGMAQNPKRLSRGIRLIAQCSSATLDAVLSAEHSTDIADIKYNMDRYGQTLGESLQRLDEAETRIQEMFASARAELNRLAE